MNLIDKHSAALQDYCKNHNIVFEKLRKFPRCGNNEVLFIQHYDPNKTGKGLANNVPAEVILSAYVAPDGSYRIEEGENLRKYLSELKQ